MPKLIRFYITHVLIGFAVAAAFVAMLLWFNVANLTHLIFTSDVWAVALFMLWFFHGIVFAGVQFGIAVMAMAEKPEDRGPRGGHGVRSEPVPVRVAAEPKRNSILPHRRNHS
ncbi:hypothetical protein E4Z66_11325 [Aliishimia ponticola]|uniref:Uncharacterized protein n=1 Tax=Aliishimia ponticola TaxID=2499833 RepID=A0A4S4NB41_9RHOB|nr:hypothetical protein [Aliishimia ponticola]THH35677.1 hypothetical protein E4Z66_11325 [Aliishimia ponticola]